MVGGHLGALVPGQRARQMRRQSPDGPHQRVAHVFRAAAVGQVHQHHVAGRALDEGANRRAVVLPDDEVAFPVAWYRPVLRLRRTFTDHDHRLGEARLTADRLAARAAAGASRAQGPGQLPAQFSAALDVEGLVDRFVHHVHLRLIGEAPAQALADLFRAPLAIQSVLDEVPQRGVLADLAGLGARPAGIRPGLGRMRSVVPLATRVHGPVAANLPADRRRAAAKLGGDRPDGGLLPQTVRDLDALGLAQVPGRHGSGHPLDVGGRPVPLRIRPAITPLATGPLMHTDESGCLYVAVTLLHEPEVFRPLATELPRPLRLAVTTDPKVHRIP